ncbi:AfsR/SARP family transcriptional regulator [Streptomyces canus]|uniref:AfsR/SARP family transcriptional regulator n=1 Tax=Streptomyces canus TaxID=58343 RepID=UPI002E335495|nr:BTAD domain-containing putative transcriptional regulator [Streptomyces canus]
MQHPLKETLRARLVMLLAATGRRAEAHDVYRTVRLRLAQELGVEPGAELRAVHREALTAVVRPGGTPTSPVPPAGHLQAPTSPGASSPMQRLDLVSGR